MDFLTLGQIGDELTAVAKAVAPVDAGATAASLSNISFSTFFSPQSSGTAKPATY